MAGIADALALGADVVGKDFADVDPDDRALRERKEGDIGNQQPDQRARMRVRREDPGHARQATGRARRANQQQHLAAQLIDHAHSDHGEDQVGKADGDGLLVAAELAESGLGKDVVQVVENRVDSGQLVECADADGQKQWIAVLPAKDRFLG